MVQTRLFGGRLDHAFFCRSTKMLFFAEASALPYLHHTRLRLTFLALILLNLFFNCISGTQVLSFYYIQSIYACGPSVMPCREDLRFEKGLRHFS